MSRRSSDELKRILCLVTAAYAGYQALKLLRDCERREDSKKNTRIRAEKRSNQQRGSSSSSDELESSPKPKVKKEREESTSSAELSLLNNPSNGKTNFIESVVSKFSEKEFKKHFRISRHTLNYLNDLFKSSTEYKHIFRLGDKSQMPSSYYLLMFLWFSGKSCSYLELSKTFNITMAKAVCALDNVLQFLNNNANDYIRFPELPSAKRISAENFEEIAGFPDVIGCLLKTQIEVKNVKQNIEENIISTVQVICDSRGCLLDVFVDATHDIHPAEILKKSPINERLKEICQGRYHILASEDYNIREWLLTPHKNPLMKDQISYNEKHKLTMDGVGNTLEVLKKRFQQLKNMPSFSPYKIKKMVIACCVLHNICIEEEDCYDFDDPLDLESKNPESDYIYELGQLEDDDPHAQKLGELKRNQII